MNYKIYITILLAIMSGVLLYALSNQWIIVHSPLKSAQKTITQENSFSKKKIIFNYYKHGTMQQESRELVWSSSHVNENLVNLIKTWLMLLEEEDILLKKVTLQSASITHDTQQALLSFDSKLCNDNDSIFTKLMIIESLLNTIKENISNISAIQFLIHHETMNDYHLDFSQPWPIAGFVDNQKTNRINEQLCSHKQNITIMIDPAGDAQHAGRIIGNNFERGITLQYAQEIKKYLEKKNNALNVILTRFPGESLEQLQNASFSNRLKADIYLSLHFYPAHTALSQLFLYYFLQDAETDFWPKKLHGLKMIPYNHAHYTNINKTYFCIQLLFNNLTLFEKQGLFVLKKPIGVPFKPLVGVQAIALGCEIGLHDKNDWKMFIEPLAQSIIKIIELFNQ